MTDQERWADLDRHDPEWDHRTAALARFVAPGSRVLELGCGRRRLESLLPPGCRYQPADLVPRGEGCWVADLNVRPLPDWAPCDVVVCGGVLEYLADLPAVARWLARLAPRLVASFEVQRGGWRGRRAARRIGWRALYGEDQFVGLVQAAGFRLECRSHWASPREVGPLFVFGRTLAGVDAPPHPVGRGAEPLAPAGRQQHQRLEHDA